MNSNSRPSLSRNPAPAIEIRVVNTPEEREAVARLRYDVYVEELGRNREYADHGARTLHEGLDDASAIIGAFTPAGDAIGTIRITPSTALDPEVRAIYRWESRELACPGAVYVGSKLIVAKEQRGALLGVEIMRAAAREALRRGWRYCFLETYDELVPLYTRMGFVERHAATHPVYGQVRVMEWDMYDIDHMHAVRSPLRRDVQSSLGLVAA